MWHFSIYTRTTRSKKLLPKDDIMSVTGGRSNLLYETGATAVFSIIFFAIIGMEHIFLRYLSYPYTENQICAALMHVIPVAGSFQRNSA